MNIPIGIANSVSANFGYDPLDAIQFAIQSNFSIIQIYLPESIVNDRAQLNRIRQLLLSEPNLIPYLHADGYLDGEFVERAYTRLLFEFAAELNNSRVIIHFDESTPLEEILKSIERLAQYESPVLLENYFQKSGQENAEKNIRKYMAIFTLANSRGGAVSLFPVLDLPRFFHKNLQMENDQALQWCYQLFNYFGNRQIPVLLHLIDCREASQERRGYCPIGEGYLPYQEIFSFIKKTAPTIEGIILEYEDKINPLKSRENLLSLLKRE
ncbi:MAG: hypothetical protein Kow0042_13980 [Calditrichia bacterium]